ncbi:hypothetical protein [Allostella humosa]|nr:hypothetical protein [Stella humosa]
MATRLFSAGLLLACGIVATPTIAAAQSFAMTTVVTNATTTKVYAGVQNIKFHEIDGVGSTNNSATIYPKISVDLFSTAHNVYQVDFESMEGSHINYCQVHIQAWAKHTFFGGYEVTGCQSEVKSVGQDRRCEAISPTPSAGGCLFQITLR